MQRKEPRNSPARSTPWWLKAAAELPPDLVEGLKSEQALRFDAARSCRNHVDCAECNNYASSVWRFVQDDARDTLCRRPKVRAYRSGEYLFHENDPCGALYCVKEGVFALRKFDGHGHSLIVKLVFASEPLGYRTFFSGTNYGASAQALYDSQVCIFDRASVNRMLSGNEPLMREFLRRMAGELRECQDDAVMRTFQPVRARVAHLLVRLIRAKNPGRHAEEIRWRLPVPKHELAALLAIRPETLARCFRAMADDGVLELKGRVVRIPSLATLDQECSHWLD